MNAPATHPYLRSVRKRSGTVEAAQEAVELVHQREPLFSSQARDHVVHVALRRRPHEPRGAAGQACVPDTNGLSEGNDELGAIHASSVMTCNQTGIPGTQLACPIHCMAGLSHASCASPGRASWHLLILLMRMPQTWADFKVKLDEYYPTFNDTLQLPLNHSGSYTLPAPSASSSAPQLPSGLLRSNERGREPN